MIILQKTALKYDEK